MPDQIEPALTSGEWERRTFEGVMISADWHDRSIEIFDIGGDGKASLVGSPAVIADVPRLIAALNGLLPSSDPRKVTHEWVEAIRNAFPALPTRRSDTEWTTSGQGEATAAAHRAVLDMIADALESYLPPQANGRETMTPLQ